MLNILKTLSDYLLKMEQGEEVSCAIPDESISDWYDQVSEKLEALRQKPERDQIRIAQLEDIQQHLQQVKAIREKKCRSGGENARIPCHCKTHRSAR